MPIPEKHKALIKEIRHNYTYAIGKWGPIRDEGKTDMQYVAGDPWDPKDKKDREDAGRPALQMDELNQYVNQYINNFRQSPQGIKINPEGNGATDKTANLHQGIIRGIEYRSQAWENAYLPAAENAANRSYGFIYIKRRYMPGKSFDQEIIIEGEPNPDRIIPDPDARKADWSDASYYFVLGNRIKLEEFKRKHPEAQVTDFEADDVKDAGAWLDDDGVLLAEYWKADKVERELLLFDTAAGPQIFYKDELPEEIAHAGMKPSKTRKEETRKVTQYITNGIEILEENEQPGEYIPIVPFIGKELWIDGKRQLMSLVRLARDPQMAHCYLWSQLAEEAKKTPKTPVVGYVGQFETDKDAWDNCTDIPYTRLQVDPVVDAAPGQLLPLPVPNPFKPNFSEYLAAIDACRRATQSAMGISPLPTAAQRNNEKSGTALDKIQTQEAIGSFHFTANFRRSLAYAGRIIESWLPVIYDTEREVGIRNDDETHDVVKINTPQPYVDAKGQTQHFPLVDGNGDGLGTHGIEIATGPSYQSQRDEAADFANSLLQSIEQLPLNPAVKAKFLALIIKLRNVGPLGDEMASIVDPEDNGQQQNALAQLQQKTQQDQELIANLQAELQKLQLEKAGKVIDNQAKVEIEKMRQETSLAVAEVSTKAQDISQRLELFMDLVKQWHDGAQDSALSAQEHGQDMQQAAQTHQQNLEAGDQAAQNQAAIAASQPQDQPGA